MHQQPADAAVAYKPPHIGVAEERLFAGRVIMVDHQVAPGIVQPLFCDGRKVDRRGQILRSGADEIALLIGHGNDLDATTHAPLIHDKPARYLVR